MKKNNPISTISYEWESYYLEASINSNSEIIVILYNWTKTIQYRKYKTNMDLGLLNTLMMALIAFVEISGPEGAPVSNWSQLYFNQDNYLDFVMMESIAKDNDFKPVEKWELDLIKDHRPIFKQLELI